MPKNYCIKMDKLYRYEEQLHCGVDEWDGPLPAYVRVYLREFDVIKVTPKGAWISRGFGDKKFVLLTATKRYAAPTKEEALKDFLARKNKQISILERKINYIKEAIWQAKTIV